MRLKVSLVVLRLSLYSHQSLWCRSDCPYTHHRLPGCIQIIPLHISLPGGTQNIPILVTISLVELRLSLYASQTPLWNLEYPYTHHSLPGGTQTISILITVSLVLLTLSQYPSQSPWWLRLSLYSSQYPWWYSHYPYTHHSLSGGSQTIPILITVSLVVSRLYLYT